jgi:nucleoside-diphosphate-sugar epimerase
MKKAIVTGGAGFIGSHLCKRLRDDGYYVVSYDRKMPEWPEFAQAHEYFIFDLRNAPDFYGSFRWQDADELYQLAAEMGGVEYIFSGENDANIMHSSALINLNVLEAARQAKINKIFFASSACVYPTLESKISFTPTIGEARRMVDACRESDAGNPDSPYGLEKLFAEQLYLSYAKNHGMEVRIGRFHNIFGAYGTWRGGREKAPAAFMRKTAEMNGAIDCFGDGEQTRSFLHVSEAVEGVMRLMASDFSGPVNIGSSEMVSINQMISMIGEIAGNTPVVKHIPGPLGVRGRNSDNTLIFEKLGWKPAMTLQHGLELTYPWIREQVEKAKTK